MSKAGRTEALHERPPGRRSRSRWWAAAVALAVAAVAGLVVASPWQSPAPAYLTATPKTPIRWASLTHVFPAFHQAGTTTADQADVGGVACTAPTFCMAVAGAGIAEIFDGKSWHRSQPPSLLSGGYRVEGYRVACTQRQFCVVTTMWGNAVAYDQGRWSKVTSVTGAHPWTTTCSPGSPAVNCGGYTTTLVSWIACARPTLCIAVGNGPAPGIRQQTFVFNGSAWAPGPALPSGFTVSTPGATEPASVSCPSTGACFAAGYLSEVCRTPTANCTPRTFDPRATSSAGSTAEVLPGTAVFDGHSWSRPTVISPAADKSLLPVTISCSSATTCLAAIGNSGGNARFVALGAGHWSPVPAAPLPEGTSPTRPTMTPAWVACGSPVFCVDAGDVAGGSLLLYNGRRMLRWGNAEGAGGQVGPVSCPSATFCVGFDANGDALTYRAGPPG